MTVRTQERPRLTLEGSVSAGGPSENAARSTEAARASGLDLKVLPIPASGDQGFQDIHRAPALTHPPGPEYTSFRLSSGHQTRAALETKGVIDSGCCAANLTALLETSLLHIYEAAAPLCPSQGYFNWPRVYFSPTVASSKPREGHSRNV